MRMTRRINRPINFNPRTREGCDLFTIYLAHYYIRFQSTHPRGVRRDPLSFNTCCFVISIHAPARGATIFKFPPSSPLSDFNPRTREGCDT